jgi:hypothetical protein
MFDGVSRRGFAVLADVDAGVAATPAGRLDRGLLLAPADAERRPVLRGDRRSGREEVPGRKKRPSQYYAWYELVPRAPVKLKLAIAPGDGRARGAPSTASPTTPPAPTCSRASVACDQAADGRSFEVTATRARQSALDES